MNTPVHSNEYGGHVVDAVVEERAEQRDAGRDQLEVRAHVRQQLHPDGGDLAVGVGGELDVLDLATALDGGDGVLAAVLGPPRRDAEALGDGDGDELLVQPSNGSLTVCSVC